MAVEEEEVHATRMVTAEVRRVTLGGVDQSAREESLVANNRVLVQPDGRTSVVATRAVGCQTNGGQEGVGGGLASNPELEGGPDQKAGPWYPEEYGKAPAPGWTQREGPKAEGPRKLPAAGRTRSMPPDLIIEKVRGTEKSSSVPYGTRKDKERKGRKEMHKIY